MIAGREILYSKDGAGWLRARTEEYPAPPNPFIQAPTPKLLAELETKKRVCELTGLSFEYGRPPHGWKNHPSAPSIDQIVARKGYTPENCRVILSSLNNAFGEWGEEVYLRAAVAMLARRKI